MSEQPLSYRFGPLERRSLLGPVRPGQALVVAVAAAAAILLLDRLPNGSGVLMAICLLGLAGAVVTAPVAGRTAEEWAPVATLFVARRVSGAFRYRSPLPGWGMRLRGHRLLELGAELPPTLKGVQLIEIDRREGAIGALSELRGRRLTAVLACRVVSFSLLDPSAQERRLAQWGALLAGVANGPIRRLQWVERTAPAQPDELAKWLHSARDPALPLRGAPIVESYLELISAGTQVAHAHEVLLAIQIDGARLRGRERAGLEPTLVEQTERVARSLEAAEVKVLGALRAGPLARVLRTAFDPYSRAELVAGDGLGPRHEPIPSHGAGPLGAEEHWDHYRCDGAHHATYWIAGWPRVDVSPMFMDAILGGSEAVRTVAVTFEPVAPDRSAREVEAAITRDRADSELRRRFGQSETARQRQAQESARRREAELAAGHAEVRLSGFVTVSGRDERELRLACEEIGQQAARARLELRRMYGHQAEAFTFTLPLARGLR